MFKKNIKAGDWLEDYLLKLKGNRELEQFLLIEAEAKGFSERTMRRVAVTRNIEISDGWWGLNEIRAEALEIRARLAQGTWRPEPARQPIQGPGPESTPAPVEEFESVDDLDSIQMFARRLGRWDD